MVPDREVDGAWYLESIKLNVGHLVDNILAPLTPLYFYSDGTHG